MAEDTRGTTVDIVLWPPHAKTHAQAHTSSMIMHYKSHYFLVYNLMNFKLYSLVNPYMNTVYFHHIYFLHCFSSSWVAHLWPKSSSSSFSFKINCGTFSYFNHILDGGVDTPKVRHICLHCSEFRDGCALFTHLCDLGCQADHVEECLGIMKADLLVLLWGCFQRGCLPRHDAQRLGTGLLPAGACFALVCGMGPWGPGWERDLTFLYAGRLLGKDVWASEKPWLLRNRVARRKWTISELPL